MTSPESSVGRLGSTVFRNSMFGFGAQILLKVLSFGFSVLIVRNLGVETYGQYAAILAFGAVFVFLADLGLSPYLVREIARTRDQPDGHRRCEQLYGNVLTLRFCLSVLTAAVLISVGWGTNRPLPMVLGIALGTLGLLMYSGQGAADAMLAGNERLDLSAAPRIANQILFVLLGGTALWLGTGYFGLIVANLTGVAVMTLACAAAVRRLGFRPGRPNPDTWLPLLRHALPFGLIAFTLGLSYKIDSVLLNLFRGDAETGYYAAAYNLVFSVVVISNVINTSLFPSLTRVAANSTSALPAVCDRTLRYLLALSLPAAAGIWVLAEPLVHLLFGDSFQAAVPALRIVIWTAPLMFISEFLGYMVVIRGQEHRVARAIILSTSFNIALNLALIPHFGLIGAATMTVLTEAALVVQYVWLLRDLLSQLHWGRVLVRPALATLAMTGVVYVLRDLSLALSVGLGGVTYLAMLLLLGVLGADELRFVRGASRMHSEAGGTAPSWSTAE